MKEKAGLPKALPEPILEVCIRLEERGVGAWNQGVGLLGDLRTGEPESPCETGFRATRSLVCTASPAALLDALPRAVVTASGARRLTLATDAGPIDLLPVGADDLEVQLLKFGLSAFAFAFRPIQEQWCDPLGAREAFDRGVLDVTLASSDSQTNPFCIAPRRYWIAARLMSEYALEPTNSLMKTARAAFPDVLERLPRAAPARREVDRILASPNPELGLAFLRRSGLSPALFAGMDPAAESMIAKLGELPALRWAAWLRGCSIQRALVLFRMPPALGRRIGHLHRAHPIDRRIESLREIGVRKILAQLRREEIDGLFAWRRLELAATTQTDEVRSRSKRLDEIETRFEIQRSQRERSSQVRALALDGSAVMTALGAGPGRHVGRALAHLAQFVESNPDSNEREALERELTDWAEKNRDQIG